MNELLQNGIGQLDIIVVDDVAATLVVVVMGVWFAATTVVGMAMAIARSRLW
jgi:hypothetical protein